MRISDWSSDVCSSDLIQAISLTFFFCRDGQYIARCEALQRERGGEGGERCVVVREDVPAQRGEPGLHRAQGLGAAREQPLTERSGGGGGGSVVGGVVREAGRGK